MTVEEFNKDIIPKIRHARTFLNSIGNAVYKSGPEAMKQFTCIGWNKETTNTILVALDKLEEEARNNIDTTKQDSSNSEVFTHVCKSDREEFPGCFAIFARVIEETADWVTIDRFQKWGAVHCGIVTISRKDFDRYYTRLT